MQKTLMQNVAGEYGPIRVVMRRVVSISTVYPFRAFRVFVYHDYSVIPLMRYSERQNRPGETNKIQLL